MTGLTNNEGDSQTSGQRWCIAERFYKNKSKGISTISPYLNVVFCAVCLCCVCVCVSEGRLMCVQMQSDTVNWSLIKQQAYRQSEHETTEKC